MVKENDLNGNLLLVHVFSPRIGTALDIRWGTKEFDPYVKTLIADDKHDRKGFPMDVMMSIFNLQQLHRELFPQLSNNDAGPNSVWNNSTMFGSRN